MKIEKQLNSSHPRLLLFFAGWSASPESFTGLKAENGTDIMLCYDYRDMTFHEDLSSYKEIHLIAWSMGVRMAELALAGKYALTTATAINGTPRPIDDNFGIPENIFRGTRQPDSRRYETFQPTDVRQPGYTRTTREISCPPAGRG